jgi:antitoxin (DNA-binding transcriptional repressor) of toxin-antitoxin stability system
MQKVIEEADVAARLSEIVEGVRAHDDEVVIERDGEPVAAVVPMVAGQATECPARGAARRDGSNGRTANMSEEEANELIAEALASVRKKPTEQ